MSNPAVGDTNKFWSALIEINKQADALIRKSQIAVEPTLPISREIPAVVSIEARFNNLPNTLGGIAALNTGSDATAGNNIKKPVFQNGSSRIYVRELGFQSWIVMPASADVLYAAANSYDARIPNGRAPFPFNWRWNFRTSITQRWYHNERRCLAASGGRAVVGTHLAFREPLVIEPMEQVEFECELLGGFWMQTTALNPATSAVVSLILSGYREGV